MSDETPVERRLHEISVLGFGAGIMGQMSGPETAAIDCGREAIRIIRDLLTLDELDVGDVSILQEDEPDHPVVQAYMLLAKCREDGR